MSIVGKVNVAVLCCIRCYADVVTDLTLAPPAMGKINIEIKHQNRWSYKAYMKTVFCAHAWVCVCVCAVCLELVTDRGGLQMYGEQCLDICICECTECTECLQTAAYSQTIFNS